MHPASAAAAASPSAHVPSRWVRFFADMRFFSFSLLLHTILVIVCGTVVLYRSQEEPPQFVAGGVEGLLADTSKLEPPPETKPEQQPQETPSVSTPASQAPVVSVEPLTTTAGAAVSVAPSDLKRTMKSIGGNDTDNLGAGLGLTGGGLGMGGGGTSMRFFGTKATGQNIVIVVDVSGSMVKGKGKSSKTYGELEKEVIRVLRGFDLKSSFGLIVFSRDAKTFRSHLVRSTSEEKERAVAWLKKHNPSIFEDPKADEEDKAFHHGTRADRGLEEAFALAPDLIFFVSDGEPTGSKPAQVIEAVAAAQKNLPKPAAIHSIAYLADSGQRFMRELAEANGGLFREVNPKDIGE